MTAESPRATNTGASPTNNERESLVRSSLSILPDPADSPHYWTGWHDGRATGLEVGWQRGYEAGRRAASVELAREWLHELAAESARLAVGASAARGPAWRALVHDLDHAATPDDDGTSNGVAA